MCNGLFIFSDNLLIIGYNRYMFTKEAPNNNAGFYI